MKRHASLIVVRLLMAAGIAYALPYSDMHWGEDYPGDGQKAFGIVIVFFLISFGFSLVYFATGAAVQYFLRRKPARCTLGWDCAAFVIFASLLVYCGITAHYEDTDGQRKMHDTVR